MRRCCPIRRHVISAFLLMFVTFGGFSAWAFCAPLAAAVIAQGSGRHRPEQDQFST
jgi:hypothetical protein